MHTIERVSVWMFTVGMNSAQERSKDDDAVFKHVEELTLLLAHLTSWEEGDEPHVVRRAWKGYDFDVLCSLERGGYINGGRKAKSLTLTPEGITRAEELRARLT